MKYSIETKEGIYVKRYGLLSIAKNMGMHATKVAKNLSGKYGQKLLDSVKKSTTDAIKIASKRAILKAAEATGDLIGNKIDDKITSVSKKSSTHSQNNEANDESETPKKKIHISRKKVTRY